MYKVVSRYKKVITFSIISLLTALLLTSVMVFSQRHALIEAVEKKICVSLVQHIPDVSPKIESANVVWGGILHPLTISIDSLVIKLNEKLLIKIGTLSVEPKIGKILLGKIEVAKLYAQHFSLFHNQDQVLSTNLKMRFVDEDYDFKVSSFKAQLKKLIELSKVFQDIPAHFFFADMGVVAEGHVFSQGSDINASLKLSIERGDFIFPPYFPTPIKIDEAEISLALHNKNIVCEKLHVQHNETIIFGQGKGEFLRPLTLTSFFDNQIRFNFDGGVKDVNIDDLKFLWPQELAPKPRTWVTENLSQGKASNATIETTVKLSLASDFDKVRVDIEDIKGDIDAEGVRVAYFGDLPPVEKAGGHCHYTKHQFLISASGHVNGITLQRGDIIIHDLDKEDSYFQLEADLLGPLQNCLQIIDKNPLNLASKLGIEKELITGSAATHLYMKFLLTPDVSLDQVMVQARSKIFDGQYDFKKPFLNYKKLIEAGNFDLSIDNNNLFMSGICKILGNESTLNWSESFNIKGNNIVRKLDVKTDVVFPESDDGLIKGAGKVETTYSENANSIRSLTVDGNLQEAEISLPWFSYFKDKMAPLQFALHAKVGPSFQIENLSIKGKGTNVTSNNSSSLENNLALTIQEFGDLSGKVALSYINGKARLSGDLNYFDFEPILTHLKQTETNRFSEGDISADLKIKNISCSDQFKLRDASIKAHWLDGVLMMIDLESSVSNCKFMLSPPRNNEQYFSLVTAQGGDFIDLLLPDHDLSGGHLEVVGKRRLLENDKTIISGEMDLKRVTFVEAPLLAKLLSAASLNGLLATFSGKGLYFDHAAAAFVLQEDQIRLDNIHLYGTALGLEAEGTVQGKDKHLNFKGEIIPLYSINHFLTRIPLLGSLLAEDNKGVFTTAFKVSGTQEVPKIKINPLTTIAPSSLRNVARKVVETAETN